MRITPTIRARSIRKAAVPRRAIYSRAYLHHLFRSGEALGGTLLSIVNLFYYQDLMAGARAAVAAGGFADFAAETKNNGPPKVTGSRIDGHRAHVPGIVTRCMFRQKNPFHQKRTRRSQKMRDRRVTSLSRFPLTQHAGATTRTVHVGYLLTRGGPSRFRADAEPRGGRDATPTTILRY